MSNIAVRVESLGKMYRIGGKQERYKRFTETAMDTLIAPLRRLRTLGQPTPPAEMLWALRNVSFEVKQGEVVGIIGRNGAGKSTLLKILSRITEPTKGEARVYGRVGSLLEVGTGFHPELTGRENIYLNGAILGMKRAEIERKFDEIVDFSGVEKFTDTPVKRYSSGMQVRLAFSVAAHLEPEILLVDEVLAVGDAEFQKKCLGKMGEVAQGGRTVLFVSHNMGTIVSLCDRCLLIEKGSLTQDGDAPQVVALYQSSSYSMVEDTSDLSDAERYGTGRGRFTSVKVYSLGPDGSPQPFLRTGQDLRIDLKIIGLAEIISANVALIIYDVSGYRLIDANTAMKGSFLSLEPGQEALVQFHLRNVLLKPGLYLLGLWLGHGGAAGEDIDGIAHAVSITVEPNPEVSIRQTFPGAYQCGYTFAIHVNNLSEPFATVSKK